MFIAKFNEIIIQAEETREELINKLEAQCKVYTNIEETDINYTFYNGKYLTEEELQQQERERRNQEIDNKIKELFEMASTEMVKGNDLNVETYKAVIKSLEESKV